MIAKAISKYNRIAPKKVMLVTRTLRRMTVAEAYSFLKNVNKKASYLIYNVLKSAFDNVHKKDPAVKETDLYISKIAVDGGPMFKRYRAASMGRAAPIRRRTSHITIHLDMKELPKQEVKKTKKAVEKKAVAKRPIFKKKTVVDKKKDK